MAGGFGLRRTQWRDFGTAGKVFGVAVLISFFGILGLAHVGDTPVPMPKALSTVWQLMSVFYLPFFWLPFGLGLIVGGPCRTKQLAACSSDNE